MTTVRQKLRFNGHDVATITLRGEKIVTKKPRNILDLKIPRKPLGRYLLAYRTSRNNRWETIEFWESHIILERNCALGLKTFLTFNLNTVLSAS